MTNPRRKSTSEFLKEVPTIRCRNYDEAHYCSHGTLCRYSHDYENSSQAHVMSYLDGIVSEIKKLSVKVDNLCRREGIDRSTESSGSSRTSRRSRDTMVQSKARSRSRDRMQYIPYQPIATEAQSMDTGTMYPHPFTQHSVSMMTYQQHHPQGCVCPSCQIGQ